MPRGVPQAQAAKQDGHNDGKDQYGRTVLNPAGIDLADGLFHDALALKTNEWVTVDYLWTGQAELASVDGMDMVLSPRFRERAHRPDDLVGGPRDLVGLSVQ